MRNAIYFLGILFLSVSIRAQVNDTLPNFDDSYYSSLNVILDEVSLLPKQKFQSKDDIKYYIWLRRKVFKAYPYAVLAKQRMDTLQLRLERIDSKRAQKIYVKRVQDYLEGEFSEQLKKMTRTEGRILIKLIHRQTGQTAFDNIKDLRSGWKAFWYNTTANLFNLSLKTEYNPADVNEDYLIEDILQRAFREQHLVEQKTNLDFDFNDIIVKKNALVDVEEYKEFFSKMRKKGKIRSKTDR